jgi:hypothetical protein
LRIRVERRLPALCSIRGHRPAQEIKCPIVGKRDMSIPISATMTCAATRLTPGMVTRRAAATRKGSSAAPIWASKAAMRWRR